MDIKEIIEILKDIRFGIGTTSVEYWSCYGKEVKAVEEAINILEMVRESEDYV
ncbi:MAG: hypothetical protein MJ237_08640 [bacterium]|nr:hypothetical protein [bacterium]